jgi:hypothetical protein
MTSIKVFDHKYADLYWTPETGVFEEIYKVTTSNATDEQLIQYHIQKLDIMSKYCCIGDDATTKTSILHGMILDTRYFFHEISPYFQQWIDENIVTFLNQHGCKRIGVIFSQGLLEQLSLEEGAADCANDFELQFFFDKAAANSWLLQSS